jgi:hypothetical protein
VTQVTSALFFTAIFLLFGFPIRRPGGTSSARSKIKPNQKISSFRQWPFPTQKADRKTLIPPEKSAAGEIELRAPDYRAKGQPVQGQRIIPKVTVASALRLLACANPRCQVVAVGHDLSLG